MDVTPIHQLPLELFQLPQLERISMTFCKLDSIPSSIQFARSLRIMNLEGTRINGISEYLYTLPKLDYLLICDSSKIRKKKNYSGKDYHFELCD